jgi:hypothetical protein
VVTSYTTVASFFASGVIGKSGGVVLNKIVTGGLSRY